MAVADRRAPAVGAFYPITPRKAKRRARQARRGVAPSREPQNGFTITRITMPMSSTVGTSLSTRK